MFNYLYYKLYQASLKSSLRDIPEFLAPVFLGGLVSANILVISAFLAKLDVLPFLFSNKAQGGVFALIIIVLAMFYYRKVRYRLIIKKYSQENDKERIRGNVIVAIYVALSFLLIFAVAFFKPGKL
jgi:membrane protein implicated in regulation of membrane protease activity